jgi:glucose-1-phosphatase
LIKNIIFDLGNVLVDVKYEWFREKIYADNVSKETYNNFFLDGNYRLLGYEAGQITTDEFVQKCIKGLNLKMRNKEFIDAFNDMFVEIEPMKKLVKELAGKKSYNLFLLSNTSPLHFEYIKNKFNFINSLHKFGLSYEFKSLKPDDKIYESAINYFDVKPAECLFIDDLEDNCRAAEKFGIRTVVYDKKNHPVFAKEFDSIIN